LLADLISGKRPAIAAEDLSVARYRRETPSHQVATA